MSHLPLSLMNRFNKTESAVFKLWMLYFQRILLTEYSLVICFMFNENRLVCFLFIKNDLKKSAYDDIPTLFQCPLCTIKQGMQSRDSCVQRQTSSSITLLPTGTIKVQVKSCAW